MESVIKPREIESALTRLTGQPPWRTTKESVEWRLAVPCATDETVIIKIQVGMHRKEVAKSAYGQISRRLLLDRKVIEEVLADWTHEQLMAHLQSYTAEELREPAAQMFRR